MGCHVLLQGIFPTQGSNSGLLHCRWILYHLNHQESPLKLHKLYSVRSQLKLSDSSAIQSKVTLQMRAKTVDFTLFYTIGTEGQHLSSILRSHQLWYEMLMGITRKSETKHSLGKGGPEWKIEMKQEIQHKRIERKENCVCYGVYAHRTDNITECPAAPNSHQHNLLLNRAELIITARENTNSIELCLYLRSQV